MAILKVKSFAIEASLGKSLSKTNTKYSDICQWLLKRPVKRRASVLRLTLIFFRYYELLLVFLSQGFLSGTI